MIINELEKAASHLHLAMTFASASKDYSSATFVSSMYSNVMSLLQTLQNERKQITEAAKEASVVPTQKRPYKSAGLHHSTKDWFAIFMDFRSECLEFNGGYNTPFTLQGFYCWCEGKVELTKADKKMLSGKPRYKGIVYQTIQLLRQDGWISKGSQKGEWFWNKMQ